MVPLTSMKPPFWRSNWALNQTYVSVHHMSRQNMSHLVEYLQTRRAAYYTGYPSALYLLALYLKEQGVRLAHRPSVTVTASESVLPHQRLAMREAFDGEVADFYGASEMCVCASECEEHRYHVDMEFGVLELLPVEGLPGPARRIVCTSLMNPVMPLIRYDIGDIAIQASEPCLCGRAAPALERIDGRIESYIVTPDGRQLGRLDFPFKDSHSISEAQLIQDAADHVTIRVVKAEGCDKADEVSMREHLREFLGDKMRIDVEYRDKITREPNGKFRQIVNEVLEDVMPALAVERDRAGQSAAAKSALS